MSKRLRMSGRGRSDKKEERPKSDGSVGFKLDAGKLRWDLIPYDALEEVVRVYTHGAEKYYDRNWEAGMKWSRLFSAAQRHMKKFWQSQGEGERKHLDHDSGLHHCAHAIFNMLGLIEFTQTHPEFDDRPRTVNSANPKAHKTYKKEEKKGRR